MIQSRVEVLRAACCIAGIDGEITSNERELLKGLATGVGVGAASLQAMIDRAVKDPEFYKEQFGFIQADPEQALSTLLEVAAADGRLGNRESALFNWFGRKLGVTKERLDAIVATKRPASHP